MERSPEHQLGPKVKDVLQQVLVGLQPDVRSAVRRGADWALPGAPLAPHSDTLCVLFGEGCWQKGVLH